MVTAVPGRSPGTCLTESTIFWQSLPTSDTLKLGTMSLARVGLAFRRDFGAIHPA